MNLWRDSLLYLCDKIQQLSWGLSKPPQTIKELSGPGARQARNKWHKSCRDTQQLPSSSPPKLGLLWPWSSKFQYYVLVNTLRRRRLQQVWFANKWHVHSKRTAWPNLMSVEDLNVPIGSKWATGPHSNRTSGMQNKRFGFVRTSTRSLQIVKSQESLAWQAAGRHGTRLLQEERTRDNSFWSRKHCDGNAMVHAQAVSLKSGMHWCGPQSILSIQIHPQIHPLFEVLSVLGMPSPHFTPNISES